MAGGGGRADAGKRIVARASVVIPARGETGVARTLPVGTGLASWARLASGTLIVTSIMSVRSIAGAERTMAVTLLIVLVRRRHHSITWEDSVFGNAGSSATARQMPGGRAWQQRHDFCRRTRVDG